MKYEEALNIIEKRMKPDAVNLTAVAWSQPQTLGDETRMVSPRRRLFAMTFDRFGGRWVSLFDIRKEGDRIEMKDVAFGYDGASNVSVHTADNGDLEIDVEPTICPRNAS